jgi:YbgC/YbaW family acyl-CoA thioester hydrolase
VFTYRLRRRVQFYETDLAGVVHFSWYLRYMEEAEHAMWRAAGLSIAPRRSPMGFPRVSATVNFHAPLFFEDEFEVQIRVESISKRSLKYACEILRGPTRISSGTMVAACVTHDAGRMEAIDIPDDIVARLSRDAAGAQ